MSPKSKPDEAVSVTPHLVIKIVNGDGTEESGVVENPSEDQVAAARSLVPPPPGVLSEEEAAAAEEAAMAEKMKDATEPMSGEALVAERNAEEQS